MTLEEKLTKYDIKLQPAIPSLDEKLDGVQTYWVAGLVTLSSSDGYTRVVLSTNRAEGSTPTEVVDTLLRMKGFV